MEKENIIYVNFPITLLVDAFSDIKTTVDRIFDYAVFKHSKTLEHGNELSRMKAAAGFFEIKFGNLGNALEKAKRLQDDNSINLKSPNASINISVLWDFYKNRKSEFDIACFCAFCAIKSIIGSSPYSKTNKEMILSRMFGISNREKMEKLEYPQEFYTLTSVSDYLQKRYAYQISPPSLSNSIKSGELISMKEFQNGKMCYRLSRGNIDNWYRENKAYENDQPNEKMLLREKYSKRYHIDKVLTELQIHWGLKLYSDHSRGFYLSFTKTLEDLATITLLAKKHTNESILSNKKKEAKEAAIRKLGL